jgi:hypothetical protein
MGMDTGVAPIGPAPALRVQAPAPRHSAAMPGQSTAQRLDLNVASIAAKEAESDLAGKKRHREDDEMEGGEESKWEYRDKEGSVSEETESEVGSAYAPNAQGANQNRRPSLASVHTSSEWLSSDT